MFDVGDFGIDSLGTIFLIIEIDFSTLLNKKVFKFKLTDGNWGRFDESYIKIYKKINLSKYEQLVYGFVDV